MSQCEFDYDERLRRRNNIMLHVIKNEKTCSQKCKLQIRWFCTWLLNRG